MTPVSYRREDQEYRVCPVCRTTFRTANTRQTYCNLSCAHQAQRPEREVLERTCLHCVRPFRHLNPRQRYCGAVCSTQAVANARRGLPLSGVRHAT
jgi:hypothetical protein